MLKLTPTRYKLVAVWLPARMKVFVGKIDTDRGMALILTRIAWRIRYGSGWCNKGQSNDGGWSRRYMAEGVGWQDAKA